MRLRSRLALVMAIAMLAVAVSAVVATAKPGPGRSDPVTVEWALTTSPTVHRTADYGVNPNGLIHQWRDAATTADTGFAHLVFQPVGQKWSAADCNVDDPDYIQSSGPWTYTESRYVFYTPDKAPLVDGAKYWVCFYG